MKRMLVMALMMATVALPGRLVAHEGHAHKVMGTVTAIDASHVELDTTAGNRESFRLTAKTRYVRGTKAATAADVEAGDRVVLAVVEEHGVRTATEVRVGEERHEHQGHQH